MKEGTPENGIFFSSSDFWMLWHKLSVLIGIGMPAGLDFLVETGISTAAMLSTHPTSTLPNLEPKWMHSIP